MELRNLPAGRIFPMQRFNITDYVPVADAKTNNAKRQCRRDRASPSWRGHVRIP